jgi:hypothetical protein
LFKGSESNVSSPNDRFLVEVDVSGNLKSRSFVCTGNSVSKASYVYEGNKERNSIFVSVMDEEK